MSSHNESLQADRDWLLAVCKNDKDAADFLFDFFAVCHLWDDLIDKDVERSEDDINRAFFTAFIELPENRYYQRYFRDIQPVMANAMMEWMTANSLERSRRTDISYTLRCSIVSLIHQAAYLCGGYEWATSVGEEIRLKTQNETYKQYIGELKCQT
jgi:hypothetical protein